MQKLTSMLLVAFCLLTACKKSSPGGNNNDANNPFSSNSGTTDLIKQVTIASQTTAGVPDTTYMTYFYDSQNRCNEEISGQDTSYYTYTSNTMTATKGSLAKGGTFTTTYYLNADGTADSARLVVVLSLGSYGSNTSITLFRYTYANGYLSTLVEYAGTAQGDSLEDVIHYTVGNGNFTTIADSAQAGSIVYTYNNMTSTTAALPPDPALGALAPFGGGSGTGTNVLGKNNTNLLASYPIITGTVGNFTYTLDSRNRISTRAEKFTDSTPIPGNMTYFTYY